MSERYQVDVVFSDEHPDIRGEKYLSHDEALALANNIVTIGVWITDCDGSQVLITAQRVAAVRVRKV